MSRGVWKWQNVLNIETCPTSPPIKHIKVSELNLVLYRYREKRERIRRGCPIRNSFVRGLTEKNPSKSPLKEFSIWDTESIGSFPERVMRIKPAKAITARSTRCFSFISISPRNASSLRNPDFAWRKKSRTPIRAARKIGITNEIFTPL